MPPEGGQQAPAPAGKCDLPEADHSIIAAGSQPARLLPISRASARLQDGGEGSCADAVPVPGEYCQLTPVSHSPEPDRIFQPAPGRQELAAGGEGGAARRIAPAAQEDRLTSRGDVP